MANVTASEVALSQSTQITSYTAAGLFTVVLYDFVLKFPPELELIWLKPWSIVTVLYVLVRYLGMLVVMLRLVSSVVGIDNVKICYNLLVSYTFINLFLIVAAQAIMIIRIFALYRNSKTILYFLMSCCFVEMGVLIGCAIQVYALRGGTGRIEMTPNGLCAYTSLRENYAPEIAMVCAIGTFQAVILVTASYSFVKHFWRARHNRPELQDSGIVAFLTGNVLYFALLFVGIGLSGATYAVSKGNAAPADIGIFDMTAYTFPLFGFCIIGPYLVLSVRVAHFRAQRRARKAGFNQTIGMNAIQVQVEQESSTTVEY